MNRELYNDLITNLQMEIINQHGSVRAFLKAHDMIGSEPNMSRIFSPNDPQEISVGMYINLSNKLGLTSILLTESKWQVSLFEYLQINHTDVVISVMNLQAL